ncbi:MAG: hypothetical protein Q7J07_09745 [Pelolinea sp.]|nr:hypothetical protein [Pelolinea sp.]
MKLLNGIFKWLAVLAFSLSSGLLTIILLSNNPQINALLLRILILMAIGFFGGMFMRILFRKGFAVILILFGLITNILAVFVIDRSYETEFIFSFLPKDFDSLLSTDLGFQIPSPQDSAQMALLLLISLPAILLFRRKKTNITAESSLSKPPRQSLSDRVKPVVYKVNPKNWNIRLPKFNKVTKTKSVSTAQKSPSKSVHISSSSLNNTNKSTILKSGSQKKTSHRKLKIPGKRSRHINNDVKLMGEEEHVCPYCLEEVVKNDNHGIAVCSECNTWHHQDCWDITGGCGVAHRNEL